jgi:hypothetical protein
VTRRRAYLTLFLHGRSSVDPLFRSNLTEHLVKLFEFLRLDVPELLSMALFDRLFEGANRLKSFLSYRHLDHTPINPTALSHHIAEPFETIEQPSHIGHLSNELLSDVAARAPLASRTFQHSKNVVCCPGEVIRAKDAIQLRLQATGRSD